MNEHNNEFHKINQMQNVKNDEIQKAFLHFEEIFLVVSLSKMVLSLQTIIH